VTGGSGFIGTNLVDALAGDGISVINLDLNKPRKIEHEHLWRYCDLSDATRLKRELSLIEPTAIYHLGARTDLLSNRVEDYVANTVGVSNLIHACERLTSIRRVIFASSRLVCKIGYQPSSDSDYCPTTAYGASKVLGEQIVRRKAKGAYTWSLVRPTSIWGPWFDIPYRDFFDHVRANRYVHPAGMHVKKSFGFVENTVYQLRSIISAPDGQVAGKTFYLGDYAPIDVLVFANAIAKAFNVKPVRNIPLAALKVAAVIGDQLKKMGYKHPPITMFRLHNLCTDMLYDFWGLPEITGPLPISIEDGVARTVAWMNRSQGPSY
jgi:nucleoside-diphosphate-sugar epimerase